MSKLSSWAKKHQGLLIGGAIGGVGGLVGGAIFDSKRNAYRKNRSYIQDAYKTAQQQQQLHEGDVRQGEAESLNARGLVTPGAVRPEQSKIAAAMGAQSGYLTPSSTIGEHQQAETNQQLGLERHELDSAYQQALRENKANYITDLVRTGVGAAQTAASIAGGVPNGSVVTSAASTPALPNVDAIANQPLPGVQYAPSRIQSAMGVNDPGAWAYGIHGLDPLGAPGSAWNRKDTVNGVGGSNFDFHL